MKRGVKVELSDAGQPPRKSERNQNKEEARLAKDKKIADQDEGVNSAFARIMAAYENIALSAILLALSGGQAVGDVSVMMVATAIATEGDSIVSDHRKRKSDEISNGEEQEWADDGNNGPPPESVEIAKRRRLSYDGNAAIPVFMKVPIISKTFFSLSPSPHPSVSSCPF